MDYPAARSTRLKPTVHTRGGVTVQIGSTRPQARPAHEGGLCMVGVCGRDAPFLADVYPRVVVRTSRHRNADFYVEHIRLASRDSVAALPGLSGPDPSRVRDSVRMALSVGAPYLDVVLARVKGLRPWELDDPGVVDAVDTFLDDMPGAVVMMPDMGGPVPVGPGTAVSMDERTARFLRAVELYGRRWTQRYQVALLDTPGVVGSDEAYFLRRLLGYDLALCRWTGDARSLDAQGWRSAAAFVGGALGSHTEHIGFGLVGQSIPMPPGRNIARGRYPELRLGGDLPARLDRDEDTAYVNIDLDEKTGRGRIVSEPTFRQPVGAWALPALHAVKIIHRRVVETAEKFVFETVDDGQAIALAVAIKRSLQLFHERGLLVGPDAKGPPEVKGGPVRDAAQPGLFANINAQLRPWSQKVAIRVSLRPGSRPSLEVTS